jgi:hypothetical protein
MPTTKSGIETPADLHGKPLSAPVKHYPESGSIGKSAKGQSIDSPAKSLKK